MYKRQNHYPAIDVLQSVSRLSGDLNQKESQRWIDQARECLAEYHQHKDIITLGAYKSGSNQQIDRAIAIRPALNKFLKQSKEQTCTWQENIEALQRLLQTDHKRVIEQTQNTMAS